MNYTSNDGSIVINPGDKHIEANGLNSLGKGSGTGFHNYTSANLGSGQSTLWISYLIKYTGSGNWDQSTGTMEEYTCGFNYVSGNNSSLGVTLSPTDGYRRRYARIGNRTRLWRSRTSCSIRLTPARTWW